MRFMHHDDARHVSPDRSGTVSQRATEALAVASKGDPLTQHLVGALRERYPFVPQLPVALSTVQRLTVAATSFRPARSRWVERYFKSALGFRMRSANAEARLRTLPGDPVVLQVHALFEVRHRRSIIYVDCTHRQSATLWPAWNPMRGARLQRWYATETRQYRDAEHLFAFSRWTRDSLVSDYGVDPARVSVVGIGSNLEPVQRRPRPHDSRPTVLMVGNDFERKGGQVLLEAFAAVRAVLPEVQLVLVGTTPPIATVPPGVVVHGRVRDRAVVAGLFERADVFAMPSLYDPMPLAVVEAMNHGLPVVASTACAIPELLRDGVEGRLVPPGDPAALADALVRSLSAPGRDAALGLAGQARVREAFSWHHVVERMAPVLDPLLA